MENYELLIGMKKLKKEKEEMSNLTHMDSKMPAILTHPPMDSIGSDKGAESDEKEEGISASVAD
jgi:hypothetical protein